MLSHAHKSRESPPNDDAYLCGKHESHENIDEHEERICSIFGVVVLAVVFHYVVTLPQSTPHFKNFPRNILTPKSFKSKKTRRLIFSESVFGHTKTYKFAFSPKNRKKELQEKEGNK